MDLVPRGRRKWDSVEVQALRSGVEKHGERAWAKILADQEFGVLLNRSGKDLRGKWDGIKQAELKLADGPREPKKWVSREEQALCMGVEKYGEGVWAKILGDPEFGVLENRSRGNLRTKWRTLGPKLATMERLPKQKERKQTAAATAGARETELGTLGVSAAAVGAAAGGGSRGRSRSRRHRQQREHDSTEEDTEEDAADTVFDEMLQRKSARSVRRWNFSSLESEAVDRLQVGEDDAGETTGDLGAGRKRQRPCRPTSVSAAGAAAAADAVMEDGEESDTHIYDCPCGIQTDDGGHMIQCDLCKAWAHIACLQELGWEPEPDHMQHICPRCQHIQQPDAEMSSPKRMCNKYHAAEGTAAAVGGNAAAGAAAEAAAVQLLGHVQWGPPGALSSRQASGDLRSATASAAAAAPVPGQARAAPPGTLRSGNASGDVDPSAAAAVQPPGHAGRAPLGEMSSSMAAGDGEAVTAATSAALTKLPVRPKVVRKMQLPARPQVQLTVELPVLPVPKTNADAEAWIAECVGKAGAAAAAGSIDGLLSAAFGLLGLNAEAVFNMNPGLLEAD